MPLLGNTMDSCSIEAIATTATLGTAGYVVYENRDDFFPDRSKLRTRTVERVDKTEGC